MSKKIEVISAFFIGGIAQEEGDVIEVDDRFASELKQNNKAVETDKPLGKAKAKKPSKAEEKAAEKAAEKLRADLAADIAALPGDAPGPEAVIEALRAKYADAFGVDDETAVRKAFEGGAA